MFKKIFKQILKRRLLFFIFLFIPFSFPASSLEAVEISADSGYVSENFQGTNGKTLVLIQEAHVDYGAQKAILDILKNLIQEKSLRLILVEGGWGDMGLSYLRSYGSEPGRLEVADRYLREGKISAEEYLDVTSNFDMTLWGIEDPRLYEENMNVFLKVHEGQEKWLSVLSRLQEFLNQLKGKLFPPGMQSYEEKKEMFEEGKLSLLDYVQILRSLNPSSTSLERFPYLKKLVKLGGREEGFDPEKIEWEKHNLIRALSKQLTKPELARIQLLEARKNPREELAFLKSLLELYQKHLTKLKSVSVRQMALYTDVLQEMTAIDSRILFDEIENYEKTTAEALLRTSEERELARISRNFTVLKKLFELRLGAEEFEKLEKNPTDWRPESWKGFFEKMAKPFSLGSSCMSDVDEIEKGIPEVKAFYLAAKKREQALIQNTVEKIQKEKDPLAAMIVGGFHAPVIAQALKNEGYSVVVVSPRFTPGDSKAAHERYFEILKYKWGSWPSLAKNSSQNFS